MTRRPGQPADAGQHWSDEVILGADPLGAQPATRGTGAAAGPPRPVPSWLVAAAVLLACAAVLAAGLWWQHRSRVIEVTRQIRSYVPAGPDAAGCPAGSHCQPRADLGQPVNVLARRLFPDATVLSSTSVTDPETGRTVQASVVLRTPSGLLVSATAQCVPGAAPIPSRAAALPATGPAQADFVVPGAPGCSVAVAAQVPRGVPVPLGLLRRLADDPGVQLSP